MEDQAVMFDACSRKDLEASYFLHIDTVYRVCYMYFKKKTQDVEDAVQTTFLKRIVYTRPFENREHEKAWLIRTASNVCKDMLKRKERRNISTEGMELPDTNSEATSDEIFEYVMTLPDKYRLAMYLFYYEEYTCRQIAQIMKKSEGSIWNYLHFGRKQVKAMIQGEIR